MTFKTPNPFVELASRQNFDIVPRKSTMKPITILTCAAAICLLVSSCGADEDYGMPIQSGIVESGLVWEHIRGSAGSNTGTPIKKGSKVDIYERMIIIHLEDGTKQVEELSQVTKLIIR